MTTVGDPTGVLAREWTFGPTAKRDPVAGSRLAVGPKVHSRARTPVGSPTVVMRGPQERPTPRNLETTNNVDAPRPVNGSRGFLSIEAQILSASGSIRGHG